MARLRVRLISQPHCGHLLMIHAAHSPNDTLVCTPVFIDYRGGLFVQDELQCLKYPALCTLRQYLPTLPALAMALRDPTHISVSTGRPNTTTIATTSTSHLASGVERHAHMEPIVAEGRPNGLYNQLNLVHVDIMHRATESFDSRMEGCWS
jgi:hypothetical protein